jgi:ABC-type glycerol-3-phosphate transport system substrate-binding protein
MEMKRFNGKLVVYLASILLLVVLIVSVSKILSKQNTDNQSEFREQAAAQAFVNTMAQKQSGIGNISKQEIRITADQYNKTEGAGISVSTGVGGDSSSVLKWNSEEGSVLWKVNVPENGLYQMDIRYYPLPGRDGDIERQLLIDGKSPFPENGASDILSLNRIWTDSGKPFVDNKGNELAASPIEKPTWQWVTIQDAQKKVPGAATFQLTKGEHELSLVAVKEPVALSEIRIYSAQSIPTYEEVKNQYEKLGLQSPKNVMKKVQAEGSYVKSDPVVHSLNDNNPLSEPQAPVAVKLNTVGGYVWKTPGQSAEWTIEAPEAGLYQIGLRYGQFFHRGMPSFRGIQIDGKYPFRDLELYSFPYQKNGNQWNFTWLQEAKNGKPFLFYLDKGIHKLSFDVQLGPLGEATNQIQSIVRNLGELQREITMITGPEPDPNLDYGLDKRISHLVPDLDRLSKQLYAQHDKLIKDLGTGHISNDLDMLQIAAADLASLVIHYDSIPKRLGQLVSAQSTLASWLLTATEQPLQLDYFVLSSQDGKAPKASPDFLTSVWSGTKNFFISFIKNYNNIGSTYDGKDKQKVLTVWVGRGKEWAEVMKRLIDQDFTRKTGIQVNINTFPVGDTQLLLLSSASGSTPDVSLGVPSTVPVDYALRGVLANLKQFPDYDEIAKRFRPGALTPYQYNAGAYAIPETQDFNMLFYRKDIFKELGMTVPKTWNEIYDMLPIFQRKGMNFGYPFNTSTGQTIDIGGFTSLMFQNKASYYMNDGKQSGLSSPEALQAFKAWTRLYSSFRVPQEMDFFNRFRIGEVPFGVSNYNTYVLLSTAAPELKGEWGISIMPGTKEADGTIDHTAGGGGDSAVIFKQSPNQEAAWSFLKWWTSTEIQTQYGKEIEAILGAQARWNTANIEAMKRLPWPQEDLAAIQKQWESYQEVPNVPGGYYTNRYVVNAWNQTVLQGKNPREALDDAVKEINKELTKKRQEFGLPN